MKTILATVKTTPTSIAPILSPLVRALAMSVRVVAAFGLESVCRIRNHLRAAIREQQTSADELRADLLEMQQIAPLLSDCLANDPPAKRQQVWRWFKLEKANLQKISASLESHCPPHLLTD